MVIADGPRSEQEREKCERTRQVIETVDWDCEVWRNYSETNLGCKRRISSGLDWVFENYEEAIILEDDCLPNHSFFRFCSDLLERYRHDERISCISGNNFQFGRQRGNYSYYFSCFTHIWGWATWRRAWKNYDVGIKLWPELKSTSWLFGILGNKAYVNYWVDIFDKVYSGEIDTWDYQWLFTNWAQNGLTIIPQENLVSNIGFGKDATHPTSRENRSLNIPHGDIDFPLNHPPYVIREYEADIFTMRNSYLIDSTNVIFKILNRFHLQSIM